MGFQTKIKTYLPKKIEKFWQKFWEKNKIFQSVNLDLTKKKYYILDMFPYPSGQGLHLGHVEGYTATDIIARYKKTQGYNVLHPMGWDAFGLPAEQNAIKQGKNPKISIKENIKNFKKQLKELGFVFDWNREINTTDPMYYKWTQWMFLHFFKKGLAFLKKQNVWWCSKLGTVLANEEVINGKSERGNFAVEQLKLNQWSLKITKYAEKLLNDLDDLDWPIATKKQQKEWIGKTSGIVLKLKVFNQHQKLTDIILSVFIDNIDLIFGFTFLAISPLHNFIKFVDSKNKKDGMFTSFYVKNPINNILVPIFVCEYMLDNHLSIYNGIKIGVPAHQEIDFNFVNANSEKNIKIISVYKTINSYNNFISHDICKSNNLTLINSNIFNNLTYQTAYKTLQNFILKNFNGKLVVKYKLRDWLFSRQRYWGEPFPIIWILEKDFLTINNILNSQIKNWLPKNPVKKTENNIVYYAIPVLLDNLPIKLPPFNKKHNFKTDHTNIHIPLSQYKTWKKIVVNLQTGKVISLSQYKKEKNTILNKDNYWVYGEYEVNTMPQWAGSCWYYLRYIDPTNNDIFLDQHLENYWGNPDLYIGGSEHSVLHLLYARFWHKVLYDLNLLKTKEPFKRIFHQGMILGEEEYYVITDKNGEYISYDVFNQKQYNQNDIIFKKITSDQVIKKENNFYLKSNHNIMIQTKIMKMSKSRGNVINPENIINEYGADTLRMYEMFLGPLEINKSWNAKGINGIFRFLNRVWSIFIKQNGYAFWHLNNNDLLYHNHEISEDEKKIINLSIQSVTNNIESLKFNKAISDLMIFYNFIKKNIKTVCSSTMMIFLQLLAPFAPHICEEIWKKSNINKLNHNSIFQNNWPKIRYNNLKYMKYCTIGIQINGKKKSEIIINKNWTQNEIVENIIKNHKLNRIINDKNIEKVIYIPNKIINLILKNI